MNPSTLPLQEENAVPVPTRKPWQEPAIVSERSLEVAAQGGPPRSPWAAPSYLGPLSGSGQKVGGCL
ncbi:MAG: hypothetical protein NT169_22285 [Chloroflexi bacterium]|nr:hypothetical protein [Chloroflexota bacterium]